MKFSIRGILALTLLCALGLHLWQQNQRLTELQLKVDSFESESFDYPDVRFRQNQSESHLNRATAFRETMEQQLKIFDSIVANQPQRDSDFETVSNNFKKLMDRRFRTFEIANDEEVWLKQIPSVHPNDHSWAIYIPADSDVYVIAKEVNTRIRPQRSGKRSKVKLPTGFSVIEYKGEDSYSHREGEPKFLPTIKTGTVMARNLAEPLFDRPLGFGISSGSPGKLFVNHQPAPAGTRFEELNLDGKTLTGFALFPRKGMPSFPVPQNPIQHVSKLVRWTRNEATLEMLPEYWAQDVETATIFKSGVSYSEISIALEKHAEGDEHE